MSNYDEAEVKKAAKIAQGMTNIAIKASKGYSEISNSDKPFEQKLFDLANLEVGLAQDCARMDKVIRTKASELVGNVEKGANIAQEIYRSSEGYAAVYNSNLDEIENVKQNISDNFAKRGIVFEFLDSHSDAKNADIVIKPLEDEKDEQQSIQLTRFVKDDCKTDGGKIEYMGLVVEIV